MSIASLFILGDLSLKLDRDRESDSVAEVLGED
jgi:hypothetical protein